MHDNAKNKVRAETFGHPTNIFELRYIKCLSQGANYVRSFLFWNHEILSGGSERSKSLIGRCRLSSIFDVMLPG